MIQPLIAAWVTMLLYLVATPHGRDMLGRMFVDIGQVLGLRRRADMGRRWHELAAAEDAADPGLRRAAAVKDAYLAGEFEYDELEWRILLALVPPPPDREARVRMMELAQKARQERIDVSGFQAGAAAVTHSTPWSAAGPSTESMPWTAAPRRIEEGPHCRFHDLHSGSGYFGTVCDCGHVKEMHYPGGCSGCNLSQLAKKIAPPKPSDAARGVLPPTRPDPRLVDELEW